MPAQPLRREEVCARELRRRLELDETQPVADIVDAAERAGVACFLTPLPSPIAGMAGRLNGRWYIVADSATGSAGRVRFTLAHELGHAYMGHEPSIDDDTTLAATGADLPLEVQANYFAAEFLMPRNAVADRARDQPLPQSLDDVTRWIEAFAGDYGVTCRVPLYRLRTLDLVNELEQGQLERQLSSARVRDAQSDTVGAIAGTGRTWMPRTYQLHARDLEGADEPAEDDDLW